MVRPRTLRNDISHLTWKRLGLPRVQLENIIGERDVWNTLLSLDPALDKKEDEKGWMDVDGMDNTD